jgi:phosphatidylinositol alpha-mannosyltransferase
MRIAHLTRMLPRADYAGGVSGQVDLLARGLSARGHDVTVFALNPPAERAPYRFQPVRLPVLSRRFPRTAPFVFPWSLRQLALDGFDIVHSHGDDQLLPAGSAQVRTLYGSSWGEVHRAATIRHRLYHLAMALTEDVSVRRRSALVMISAGTQRYVGREAGVIPCGYDAGRFVAHGAKSERPSILFVGDLDTRKRGRLLLEVFARQIRPAVPDAELWIVSSDTPSGNGVRAFGRVPGAQLADLYRRAWVFCLPSAYEGFGVPYIEAMASGTPVVATPNGGSDEVLEGGRYGRLVAERELGAAIAELLRSRALCDRLAAAGLERAKDFTSGRIAERYEQLYLSLLDDGVAMAARRAV